jgi:hypothetical protein
MDESRRPLASFLGKELKPYQAPSLFLVKKRIKEDVRVGEKKVPISPAFPEEKMKEAK